MPRGPHYLNRDARVTEERACLDINDEDLAEGVTIRLNGIDVLTTPVASSVTEEDDGPVGFRTLSIHPSILSADQGGVVT